MNLFLITEAACNFSKLLHSYLTEEEMAQVIERNKTRAEGVCHSHDFCDANMAMLEAWEVLGVDLFEAIGDEPGMSEENMQGCSRAWNLASHHEFNVEAIQDWLKNRKAAVIEAALNETCRSIQTYIGQPDGGVAGIFFTGPNRDIFDSLIGDYFDLEQTCALGEAHG